MAILTPYEWGINIPWEDDPSFAPSHRSRVSSTMRSRDWPYASKLWSKRRTMRAASPNQKPLVTQVSWKHHVNHVGLL